MDSLYLSRITLRLHIAFLPFLISSHSLNVLWDFKYLHIFTQRFFYFNNTTTGFKVWKCLMFNSPVVWMVRVRNEIENKEQNQSLCIYLFIYVLIYYTCYTLHTLEDSHSISYVHIELIRNVYECSYK